MGVSVFPQPLCSSFRRRLEAPPSLLFQTGCKNKSSVCFCGSFTAPSAASQIRMYTTSCLAATLSPNTASFIYPGSSSGQPGSESGSGGGDPREGESSSVLEGTSSRELRYLFICDGTASRSCSQSCRKLKRRRPSFSLKITSYSLTLRSLTSAWV